MSDSAIIDDYPASPTEFWTPVIMRRDDSSFYWRLVPSDITRRPMQMIEDLETWVQGEMSRAFPVQWADIEGKPTSWSPVSWTDVSGKPSTFPPAAHTHIASEVIDLAPLLSAKMDKATYDSNNSGVVDSSEAAPWSGITGKPSTFPPSAHSTAWSDITGVPSTFPPSAHTHSQYAAAYGSSGNTLTNPRVYVATGTVSSGTIVLYLTDNGLVGGNALFSTILRIDCGVYDSTTVYAFNPVVSNANKTLTVTVAKAATPLLSLLGINILAAPTTAPNGTSVNVTVVGY